MAAQWLATMFEEVPDGVHSVPSCENGIPPGTVTPKPRLLIAENAGDTTGFEEGNQGYFLPATFYDTFL